jgi:hypothetical protein
LLFLGASNPLLGITYVLLFVLGSMIGMGALSAAIAFPLAMSARYLVWANRGLQVVVGCYSNVKHLLILAVLLPILREEAVREGIS